MCGKAHLGRMVSYVINSGLTYPLVTLLSKIYTSAQITKSNSIQNTSVARSLHNNTRTQKKIGTIMQKSDNHLEANVSMIRIRDKTRSKTQ